MNAYNSAYKRIAFSTMLVLSMLVSLALSVSSVFAAPMSGTAVDGDGMITIDIDSVVYGSSSTFVFTYTAVNDFGIDSQVALSVPAEWTAPTTAPGAGQVTVTNTSCTSAALNGIIGTGPWTIVVDMECLDTQSFSVSYAVDVVTASVASSPYAFTAQTKAAGGTFTSVAASPAVSVTAKALTVTGITVGTKTYNGNTSASLSGTGTLSGKVGTDDVSLVGTPVGTFADKNVGTNKTVYITGFSLSGTDISNYTLTAPTRTGTINPKSLTVTGVTINNKVYDGTTNATIASNAPVLNGLIVGDSVTLGGTATNPIFTTKNAGNNRPVTFTGLSISGSDAVNYTFTQSTAANITTKPITVTAVTDTKVYDRTTKSNQIPTITPALLAGDTIGTITQAYNTVTAGTEKTITPSGKANDGNNGNNYTYTYAPVSTGAIEPKPLSISGLSANDKIYDGMDLATLSGIPTLVGVISPDVVIVSGTATGTFLNKHVGAEKSVTIGGLSLGGTDSGNYALTEITSTADITAKAITITAVSDTKTYDGTVNSSNTPTITPPLATGDTAGTVGQTYDTAAAGTNKTLTPAGLIQDGNSGSNYSYTYTSVNTGTIEQKLVTITASDADMAFGTTPPVITPNYSNDFVSPDTSAVLTTLPTCSTTATNTSPVGIYPSTCTGAAASNYTFAYIDGTVNVTLSWVLAEPSDGANLLTQKPDFDWVDYEGATGYTLQLAKNPEFTTSTNFNTTASQYSPVTNLNTNTLYYWRVQAKLANGILSPWSEANSFTTANPPSMPKLVVPANNLLTTLDTPLLDWSDSTLPAGTFFGQYRVQISKDTAFSPASTTTYTTAEDVITASSSAFFIAPYTPLNPNTTYYWRVRSENDLGEYSNWSAYRSFRTALLPPTLNSPAGTLTNKRPTFSWTNPFTDPPQAPTSYTFQLSTASNFSSFVTNTSVKTTTFTPTADLLPNKTYYWRVNAAGSNGPSIWVTGSFTTGNPPTTPALLLPSNNALISSLTPTLDWETSKITTGSFVRYELEIDNNADFSSPEITNNSITIIGNSIHTLTSNLDNNTRYYWRVRAINLVNSNENFSSWSKVATFRTVLQPPTLKSPISTTPIQGSLRPTLSWASVLGATGYEVQISSNGGVSYTVLSTNVAGPNYTPVTTLLPNTTYYWKVRSLGYNGPSTFSSTATFKTGNPPAVPTLISPANAASNQPLSAQLDWSTTTAPEGTFVRYEVQVDNNSNFLTPEFRDTTTLTDAGSSLTTTTPLAANTKYFWRVRAVSLLDGVENYSNWSAIRYFTTERLATPGLISPADRAVSVSKAAGLHFDWNPITNATSYTFQLSKSSSFATVVISVTSVGDFYDTLISLTGNTTYYWRVRANNSAGSSVWAVRSFTTGP